MTIIENRRIARDFIEQTLTRDRLKKYGIKDETYSSTLNKLMDNMDSINNKSNSFSIDIVSIS